MKRLIVVFLSTFLLLACSSKTHSMYVGEYDELFKDDGKFVPINSAEIQRELEQMQR